MDDADDFKIEHGIPLASDRAASRHRSWPKPQLRDTFARMRVGDSFTVFPHHYGGAPLIVVQNIVSSAASAYSKDFPLSTRPRFSTRQQGGRFVRCWRTS